MRGFVLFVAHGVIARQAATFRGWTLTTVFAAAT